MDDVEIIVVANGCTDEYVKNLGEPFNLIWENEQLGYTKAINLGLKAAKGDYIILLNDDVFLMPQSKNTWIDMLSQPFQDPNCGITGVGKFDWEGWSVIAFWCAMFPKNLIDKIGFLDEIFSPGHGEDIDFCIKAQSLGLKIISVPENMSDKKSGLFPIYHIGAATFPLGKNKTQLMKRADEILRQRYVKISEFALR